MGIQTSGEGGGEPLESFSFAFNVGNMFYERKSLDLLSTIVLERQNRDSSIIEENSNSMEGKSQGYQ